MGGVQGSCLSNHVPHKLSHWRLYFRKILAGNESVSVFKVKGVGAFRMNDDAGPRPMKVSLSNDLDRELLLSCKRNSAGIKRLFYDETYLVILVPQKWFLFTCARISGFQSLMPQRSDMPSTPLFYRHNVCFFHWHFEYSRSTNIACRTACSHQKLIRNQHKLISKILFNVQLLFLVRTSFVTATRVDHNIQYLYKNERKLDLCRWNRLALMQPLHHWLIQHCKLMFHNYFDICKKTNRHVLFLHDEL